MRVQQAAYLLPQVVKPADYLDEGAPHFEQHLDTLGLILLQRAAAGGRPSRWIAPGHLAAAVRHLDALGVQQLDGAAAHQERTRHEAPAALPQRLLP